MDKTTAKKTSGFSAEERQAMKDRAAELKAEKVGKSRAADASDVLEKIKEMGPADQELARQFHELVTGQLPDLTPRLWYGMPAYAKDGKVLCFFQSGEKMKTRYSSIGFSDTAQLDDGAFWPTAFAVTSWHAAVKKQLSEVLARAVG